uniref:Reverse transcriptase Ty1/copia-type domain-containing protein n=1 Tax=Tanacetum cinerariifolium TaxID=118510 RepID=A0A699GM74_TANCI|nr:hypothetical protein [Tanacetum cinerariifolium]
MALPVQNINHLSFRSMFEREKLSRNNFNDWFRQLKLVLRVKKEMFGIEQPILPPPVVDSAINVLAKWNAIYDAYNEVACLMLGSMTLELHRQFKNYSPYEMLQNLKSMFGKQAGVESDFAGFVRNYNMHNMGKTICELQVMLIEYEKGKMTRKPFQHRTERATDLLGIIHTDVCGPLRHVSRQESITRIFNMVPTKKVDKTPYEIWYGKVPNLSYLKFWGCEALVKRDTHDKLQQRSVKFSGRAIDLEEIQDEDTSPSEITSKISMEVKAAMLDPESNKWLDAMNVKMQSMIDNKVWVLVDLPPNCNTVEIKWIFKKKTDMDGIVHTYEAHLVVKGYTQLYEVNYEETFSSVADIRAIRILISIAAFYDYEIWKMNVKTVFLNGYLGEDIYMVQPEGSVDPKHPKKVCKIQRSIYYLKQVSRSWNKRFDEEIKKFGFAQNLDEPYVYQKASGSNVIFLILDRSKRLIGLSQSAFIDKILKRYKMDNSKRSHIPMQEIFDLNKHKVLQDLKRNPKAEIQVDCYCDAGFETNRDDIKSQTGYVFILNGGAVDWKRSKQSTTAVSAIAAGYIAASEATMC